MSQSLQNTAAPRLPTLVAGACPVTISHGARGRHGTRRIDAVLFTSALIATQGSPHGADNFEVNALRSETTRPWTFAQSDRGMPTKLHRTSLATLVVIGMASTAHAARPLSTDDTGVLDKGGCEAEAVLSRDKSEGVTARGQSLQLGCGLGGRTQAAIAVDQAREDGLRVRGITASGKFALLPSDKASWSVSGAALWVSVEGQGHRHAATVMTGFTVPGRHTSKEDPPGCCPD